MGAQTLRLQVLELVVTFYYFYEDDICIVKTNNKTCA